MRLMLDTSYVSSFEVGRAVEPKTDRETKQQRADTRTGELLWLVQLVAKTPEGAQVINVTVAGNEPKLTVDQQVHVTGLEAIPWNQGERSGVAYRAQSITPAASNGKAREAAGASTSSAGAA